MQVTACGGKPASKRISTNRNADKGEDHQRQKHQDDDGQLDESHAGTHRAPRVGGDHQGVRGVSHGKYHGSLEFQEIANLQ